jgi:transketolase
MDAVKKCNCGHPGTAMALAPLAYTIFRRFLTLARKLRMIANAAAVTWRTRRNRGA